jgi:hypothetical protein
VGGAAVGNSHGGTVSTLQTAFTAASADVAQLTVKGLTVRVIQITIPPGFSNKVASPAR